MKKIEDLTTEGFTTLLDEYFAPAEKRSKMNEDEIKDLAIRLNKKINVPIISETKEEKIIIKIVIKIDRFLYDNLPNEFYELIRTADEGIDDKEAKRLIKRLSKLANNKIDIPYLPESVEYIAIRFVIGIIVNAARKHLKLTTVRDRASEMDIPKIKHANSKQLENILI